MGLGMFFGPAVGSILYSLFGFSGTFYSIGGSLLIASVILCIAIPSSVDQKDFINNLNNSLDPQNEHEVMIRDDIKPIRYIDIFRHKIFTLTAISGFMSYFQYSYMEPVLALRVNEFGISPFWLGMFFSINAIGYIIM